MEPRHGLRIEHGEDLGCAAVVSARAEQVLRPCAVALSNRVTQALVQSVVANGEGKDARLRLDFEWVAIEDR